MRVEGSCLNCPKTYIYREGQRAGLFCSNQCQADYAYKQFIERWKQGLEDGITGGGGTRYCLKRYMLEKSTFKCMECGWGKVHPITGRIVLELDHIDGNALNNKEENLRILCPNCHALTPTYKALNKGRGRRNAWVAQFGRAPDL